MKRATIRTEHDRPELVAAALEPDNTDEMTTRVESTADDDGDERASGRAVVTTIERETTGSLRTTADDYVTNLAVAQHLIDTTTQS
ncbi:KEOPS complex Pcc1-like subunit [Natronomonas salina]|uniref:KEOPS complex subunit Pcc1 n=1 Tax=Natronomonas salina TaxID=1710540 RepID=UPI0015B6A9AF|nr:KEOPS complex subunit Pcc1 [Natronomonas salina]QLD88389.1 KEOPS complex Pcc1-like subunit [Natronomonas salina]